MSDLLFGRALVWSCYDPSGVVSAVVHAILRDALAEAPIRTLHIPADSIQDVGSDGLAVGLAIWRLNDSSELAEVCNQLTKCQNKPNSAIRIIYLPTHLRDWIPVLCEAGAQVVVSQVPSLQRLLENLVSCENLAKIPLSMQGFHPLTSGLINRLPWPELED